MAKLRLLFTETMRGFLSQRELKDHSQGEKLGRQEKNRLEFTVTIVAEDLDLFLNDPAHEAALTGTIFYSSLHGTFPINRGTFNLFHEQDGTKKMTYEIHFSDSQRTPYVLTGQKLVVDDPGVDVWTDTTTLFSELRKGDSAGSPVEAVGIIRVHLVDLLRQLTTIRVRGGSAKENAQGVARFGRFFFGVLWDTYVRQAVSSG